MNAKQLGEYITQQIESLFAVISHHDHEAWLAAIDAYDARP